MTNTEFLGMSVIAVLAGCLVATIAFFCTRWLKSLSVRLQPTTKFLIRKTLALVVFTAMIAAVVGLLLAAPDFFDNWIFRAEPRLLSGETIHSLAEAIPRDTQVIIQVFWHSSCGYCELQLEYASRIAAEIEGVVLVAMNVGESTATVRGYWEKHDFEGVCLLGFKKDIAPGFPYTAVFTLANNQFNVVMEKIGLIQFNELAAVVAGVLGETDNE